MNSEKSILADGCYPINAATLYVKDGKVSVLIKEDFGLPPGTTLPLLRIENNMEVGGELTKSGFFNGHAII